MRLSFLVCHRVFQTLDKHNTRQLAVEHLNIRPQYHDLPQPQRTEQFQKKFEDQGNYQRRNGQAILSHTKTRIKLCLRFGI